MVDQNAALGLIDELRVAVPEEVRAAKRINAEGERIIEKAQDEAERIVAKAQEQAAFLIDERGLTQAAEAQSREIIAEAHRDADEIRRGADDYAVERPGQPRGRRRDARSSRSRRGSPCSTSARREIALEAEARRRLERRPLGGRGDRAVHQPAVTAAEPGDGPLVWNVAGLLADDPGAERVYPVAGATIDPGDGLRLAAPIDGRVRFMRTNRGILAYTDLQTSLALECSRCLRDVVLPVDIRFQEEYLPSLDLATGRPLPTDDEPESRDCPTITRSTSRPPVRDAIVLAEPIAPLCRPDCPGLCIVCGGRLDEGAHDHPVDDIDPRLEALRAFDPDAARSSR